MSKKQNKKLLTGEILKQAFIGSVKKLDPRYMIKNPVMFVVETGFFHYTAADNHAGAVRRRRHRSAYLQLDCFHHSADYGYCSPTLAESVAEGRGKAQAASLKKTQKDTQAHLLRPDGSETLISSSELKKGRHRDGNRPERSFPATARSSRVLPRWMSRPSLENPPRRRP